MFDQQSIKYQREARCLGLAKFGLFLFGLPSILSSHFSDNLGQVNGPFNILITSLSHWWSKQTRHYWLAKNEWKKHIPNFSHEVNVDDKLELIKRFQEKNVWSKLIKEVAHSVQGKLKNLVSFSCMSIWDNSTFFVFTFVSFLMAVYFKFSIMMGLTFIVHVSTLTNLRSKVVAGRSVSN